MTDEPIPLSVLARKIRRSYQTLWRWVKVGCTKRGQQGGERVRLRPTYLGGSIHVLPKDWEDFLEEQQ